MRILIATDTYYPNLDGASYFTKRLARRLTERGHHVLVIAPSVNRKTHSFIHEHVSVVGIASLPSLFHRDYRFCQPLFLTKKIQSFFVTFNPEIVHIQGHFFIERAVAKLARTWHVPVLGTNHFMPENLLHYLPVPKSLKKLIQRLMWVHFKKLFNTLPLITTPTKTAASVLKEIGVTQPVQVVSCGIDTHFFNPLSHATRKKLPYDLPEKPFVLCVNRLAPEKHVDSIIWAIHEARQHCDARLVVVGRGNEYARLVRLTSDLDLKKYVTFLTNVTDEDLPTLYARAHIFVIAGTAELQSLVTMEAMACGLPIIAANALALPELVCHRKNGFLFTPGDTKRLSNYIERMLEDTPLHDRMAKESLNFIAAHDEQKTIVRFEEMYQSLLQPVVA